MTTLVDTLREGYGFAQPVVTLGAALDGTTVVPEPKVAIPLAMMNRHGLIAGATGTGKTKTLQLLAEQLSAQGVAVFVADVKGDVSGLAPPGYAHPPSRSGSPPSRRCGSRGARRSSSSVSPAGTGFRSAPP